MASWSVSRIFRNVYANDFSEAVLSLKEKLEQIGSQNLFVEVGLYRSRRGELSSIGVDRDTRSMVTRLNPVEAFRFVADPKEITPEMWKQADYVEAVLHPVDGGNVTARIEAKGLNTRQMTFAVGPDNPGEQAQSEILRSYRYWFKDDGVNSNRLAYGI
jgi:hypothetical protein